jgi:RHS repeat-associated protein
VQKDGVPVAAYEYDVNGNRRRTVEGGSISLATVDAQDRLIAYGEKSYGYRESGELRFKAVGSDTTWYRYSNIGSLIEVRQSNGTLITYPTDAEGRRVGKAVNGTAMRGWLYDANTNVIAELGPGAGAQLSQVISRFVYGEGRTAPEYMQKGGVTYRLITDERGSVRLVANAVTGEVMQRLDYDAYGRVTTNTNPGFQPFGFAGGLYDDQTSLTRFGARDYDAETGRWTTKDPMGIGGGSLNLYEYASNDPLNRVDRSGLSDYTLASQMMTAAVLATVATIATHVWVQSQLNSDDGIGSIALPFDFKIPNTYVEGLETQPLVQEAPQKSPKQRKLEECKAVCTSDPDTKSDWCSGNTKGVWRKACYSAAITDNAAMWLGFCYARWGASVK